MRNNLIFVNALTQRDHPTVEEFYDALVAMVATLPVPKT